MKMTSHYPWRVSNLTAWLKFEMQDGNEAHIAEALGVSLFTLYEWQCSPEPRLNMEHLRAIASYRGWSLERTIQWLQILPAHVDEMVRVSGG